MKGCTGFFRKRPEEVKSSERYLYVLKRKNTFTVKLLCKITGVTESGYYRWLKNCDKPSKQELLLVKIRDIITEHQDNDNYGVDRILLALSQRGEKYCRSTIYRAMKEGKLLHIRRKPHGITKVTDEIQERENIIKGDFSSNQPLRKILSDITETQCVDGKLYISPMFDCFNGEIVALEMRNNMKKELCVDTVKQLRQRYGNLQGVILHTDRGCQYTSQMFRSALSEYGMVQSLSSTGKCYDNARMESFFATLKKEKLYRMPTYKMTREEVKREVFRYIFAYYNTIRIASFNPSGLSPAEMRKKANRVAA